MVHYAWILSFENKLLHVEYVLGTFEGSDLHIMYMCMYRELNIDTAVDGHW